MSPKQLAALGDKFATNPVCVGPFSSRTASQATTSRSRSRRSTTARRTCTSTTIVFKIMTDPAARAAEPPRGRHPGRGPRAIDRSPDAPEGDSHDQPDQVAVDRVSGDHVNIGNKNGLVNCRTRTSARRSRSRQYLRTAFDLALDRTTINKVVFGGRTSRLLPVRTGQPLVLRRDEGHPVQPARARCRRAKARSSVPGRRSGVTVHLMLGTDPVAARLGQVIQAMEKAVGIDVVARADRVRDVAEPGGRGNFDDLRNRLVGPRRPGRQHLRLRRTRPGTQNDSGYSNAEARLHA